MGTKRLVGRGCEGSGMLDEPSEPGAMAELAHAAAELDKMRRKQANYDQFHESGSDIALLTAVFEDFAANTKRRGLASLRIDVAEYRQDAETTQPASHRLGWRSVWRMSEETCHTFTVSLGATRSPIQELNFFCNDCSGRCSLHCNQLSRCDWKARGVTFMLANVESLSTSISDRVLNETAYGAVATRDSVEPTLACADAAAGRLVPNLNRLRKQATDDGNFSGLVAILNSCQKLRKLDLRRCYVRRRRWELNDYNGEKFLQQLAEVARLDNLETLSLGNFAATEQALMALLRHHPVRHLTLVKITLSRGAWDDFFDHCTNKLSAFHFEYLSRDCLPVLFDDCDEEIEDPVLKGLPKPQNVYIRRSNALRKPIAWHIPRCARLGPVAIGDERMEMLTKKFGPPASHYASLFH